MAHRAVQAMCVMSRQPSLGSPSPHDVSVHLSERLAGSSQHHIDAIMLDASVLDAPQHSGAAAVNNPRHHRSVNTCSDDT